MRMLKRIIFIAVTALLVAGIAASPGLFAQSVNPTYGEGCNYSEPVGSSITPDACGTEEPSCFEPVCSWSCWQPCVYVQVEGMFLSRTNCSDDQPLVIDTLLPPGENVLLSTNDLNFGYEPGVRFTVGAQLWNCWALEYSFLGLNEWDSRSVVVGADNLSLPGDLGLALNDFFNADRMQVDYSSQFYNSELNLVKTCCSRCCCDNPCDDPCENSRRGSHELSCCSEYCVSWFGGFRYLALNEQLNIGATDLDEGTSSYQVRTRNNLYGGQLGARVRRRVCRRLGWEGTGKVGLFVNSAEQKQYISDFPPPFLFRPTRTASDTNIAFLGELGLSLIYQMTDAWSLRAGYNLIWIEGVALAPDQLDFSVAADAGTSIDTGGGVLIHGANFGLEGRW